MIKDFFAKRFRGYVTVDPSKPGCVPDCSQCKVRYTRPLGGVGYPHPCDKCIGLVYPCSNRSYFKQRGVKS